MYDIKGSSNPVDGSGSLAKFSAVRPDTPVLPLRTVMAVLARDSKAMLSKRADSGRDDWAYRVRARSVRWSHCFWGVGGLR